MWICKSGHKNQDSNEKCHTVNCFEIRPITNWKDQYRNVTKLEDYCPKCKTWTVWVRLYNKKIWKCVSCKRKAKMTGPPKPKPVEIDSTLTMSDA
jgi:ribosomal protein L37AE/L43A